MYLYGVLLLCASSFLVGHTCIEEGKGVSREEELELEKQLELLNKPAVTTIHMRPTSFPRRAKDQVSPKFAEPVTIGLKGGGCPIGTVPIRRITKEDLIRERLRSKIKSFEDNSPGTHVDPTLYGDNLPRYFIRADAGGSHCFNTRCPGFIIVRSDIPLDGVVDRVSIVGGPFYIFLNYIIRDRANGNWWFISGSHHDEVGFWPKRIFTGLGDLANYAEWGGEAFSPLGTNPAPMGTGLVPVKIPKHNAYFCEVSVLNEYGQTVDVDNTEEFADNHKLYGVKDLGIGDSGRFVQYGGPSHGILKNY
ncbi:hypothetical protein RHMOL_Rhmol02G0222500 [Rhododendron molle]|uniref:Uncharacterized protein n=1 Tax=Rhododendron molle TaxID=49168 RepID=A0ACC0PUH9_RHOML|nr:hypothetical protein RHMOL_Rhmol02G0222500 [Rhododendron molle]